ncbi:uncharacterized protein FIBRA_03167 [Fibroporia radiculosa]|uniref:Uncharacterized protein n=1 Tax=Fibroporia radiculosa TaxID=599839 RepID=J4H292_9APHY|nr:uncharacterized protein FIBRA_03167 [Fibroporia radiculosa]CCM01119.1 predicted protein [Fibroporia radiculosa]
MLLSHQKIPGTPLQTSEAVRPSNSTSPLTAFTFNTIGREPSLLKRISTESQEDLQYPSSPVTPSSSSRTMQETHTRSRPSLYDLLSPSNISTENSNDHSSHSIASPAIATTTIESIMAVRDGAPVLTGLLSAESSATSPNSPNTLSPSHSRAGSHLPPISQADTESRVAFSDRVASSESSPITTILPVDESHSNMTAGRSATAMPSSGSFSHSPQESRSAATDLVSLISDVALERAEWTELVGLVNRFHAEHEEYLHRNEEANRALLREREQASKMFATVTSAFNRLDLLRTKQERRFELQQQDAQRALRQKLLDDEAEVARKEAAERQRRVKAQEAERRVARDEELRKNAEEHEALLRATEEKTRKTAAEEDAVRRKAEEDVARCKAEEDAARCKAEEDARRQAAEEEEAKCKLAEEEEAKCKLAEEDSGRIAQEEMLRKAAQEAQHAEEAKVFAAEQETLRKEELQRAQYEANRARVAAMKRKATEENAARARAQQEEKKARPPKEEVKARLEKEKKEARSRSSDTPVLGTGPILGDATGLMPQERTPPQTSYGHITTSRDEISLRSAQSATKPPTQSLTPSTSHTGASTSDTLQSYSYQHSPITAVPTLHQSDHPHVSPATADNGVKSLAVSFPTQSGSDMEISKRDIPVVKAEVVTPVLPKSTKIKGTTQVVPLEPLIIKREPSLDDEPFNKPASLTPPSSNPSGRPSHISPILTLAAPQRAFDSQPIPATACALQGDRGDVHQAGPAGTSRVNAPNYHNVRDSDSRSLTHGNIAGISSRPLAQRLSGETQSEQSQVAFDADVAGIRGQKSIASPQIRAPAQEARKAQSKLPPRPAYNHRVVQPPVPSSNQEQMRRQYDHYSPRRPVAAKEGSPGIGKRNRANDAWVSDEPPTRRARVSSEEDFPRRWPVDQDLRPGPSAHHDARARFPQHTDYHPNEHVDTAVPGYYERVQPSDYDAYHADRDWYPQSTIQDDHLRAIPGPTTRHNPERAAIHTPESPRARDSYNHEQPSTLLARLTSGNQSSRYGVPARVAKNGNRNRQSPPRAPQRSRGAAPVSKRGHASTKPVGRQQQQSHHLGLESRLSER